MRDEMKWVGIKDRLPETDGEYLVRLKELDPPFFEEDDGFFHEVGAFDGKGFNYASDKILTEINFGNIIETHWMNLPPEPKDIK